MRAGAVDPSGRPEAGVRSGTQPPLTPAQARDRDGARARRGARPGVRPPPRRASRPGGCRPATRIAPPSSTGWHPRSAWSPSRCSAAGSRPFARPCTSSGRRRLPRVGPAPDSDALITLAEQLLPRLRTAEWHDRAEAAVKAPDDISLRDLRAVVAGADAARDDETRALAASLREALDRRLTQLRTTWVEELRGSPGGRSGHPSCSPLGSPPRAFHPSAHRSARGAGCRSRRGDGPRHRSGPMAGHA